MNWSLYTHISSFLCSMSHPLLVFEKECPASALRVCSMRDIPISFHAAVIWRLGLSLQLRAFFVGISRKLKSGAKSTRRLHIIIPTLKKHLSAQNVANNALLLRLQCRVAHVPRRGSDSCCFSIHGSEIRTSVIRTLYNAARTYILLLYCAS